MDISKLDKLKVVELRGELQARGLDTKGVKAVLVERLRTFLENDSANGGGVQHNVQIIQMDAAQNRVRRTRSRTRSPSPVQMQVPEPALESLPEEQHSMQHDEYTTELGNEEHDDADEVNEAEDKNFIDEQEAHSNEANAYQDEDDDDMNEEYQNVDENSEAANDNGEQAKIVEPVLAEEESASNNVESHDGSSQNNHDDNKSVTEQAMEQIKDPVIEENQQSEPEKSKEPSSTSDEIANEKQEAKIESVNNRKRTHSDSRSRSHSKEHDHTKSRSRSRSSKRRHSATSAKVDESLIAAEDEPVIEDKQLGLSWFDSDIHLRIDPLTFTSAKPMTHDVFSLVWSGARTNYGVREGKVAFEVRLAEEMPMGRSHPFRDEAHTRGFRVGFSVPDTTLIVGEDPLSFAYCETGEKANNTEFSDYGKPYKLDDVIGCYLDLESTPCTIKYTRNGEDQGVAFEFEKSILGEDGALFPHIITKGYEFHVNFADNENILANVERPKRLRRKQRKEEETLTESNAANWEVVDETKPDDDDKAEESAKDSNQDSANPDADVEMKDSTGEEPQNEEPQADAKPEESTETKENAEETKADSTTANENAKIESENSESEKSKEKSQLDEENEGPSPNKRIKLDDEKRNTVNSEDEYEEVLPETRESATLLPGYELIALIPEDKYIPGPQRPESRKDCEVILLVGLPGAGKTHWTLNHIKETQDKRYTVIGADSLIAKMTINGVSRKSIHKGRWDRVYELCINSLSSLEDVAIKRRRNFILDQTNLYASAQRRKMKGFGDFKRIAVVCVPNDDELKRRIAEKTDKGNSYAIRESTLNNLRANFTLPSLEFSWFDEIIYTDLKGDEAKEEVKKYNEKGKRALDANNTNRDRSNRNRRDYNNQQRRRDFRNDRWNNDHRRGMGGSGGGGGGGRAGRQVWANSGSRQGGGNNAGGGGGYRGGQGNWGRDDRNFGYDNRNRYSGGGGQQWVGNNRNRYDDRYGGGGSRNRDNRNRPNDRNGNSGGNSGRRDNYRSGGGGNQRDFRHGHRETRNEDIRGGYERSNALQSQYGGVGSYDPYAKDDRRGGGGKNVTQNTGGKWSVGSYDQYGKDDCRVGGGKPQHMQQQQQQIHHQHQQQHQQQQSGHWQQYPQQNASQQQQYWGYNNMQGYGGQQQAQQQQQWQGATNANQQQDWMSWWQQQQPPADATGGDASHYWSQYSYPPPTNATSGNIGAEALGKK